MSAPFRDDAPGIERALDEVVRKQAVDAEAATRNAEEVAAFEVRARGVERAGSRFGWLVVASVAAALILLFVVAVIAVGVLMRESIPKHG